MIKNIKKEINDIVVEIVEDIWKRVGDDLTEEDIKNQLKGYMQKIRKLILRDRKDRPTKTKKKIKMVR